MGGVYLSPGKYDCQVVLTEESFHGSGGSLSGNWAGAMHSNILFYLTDLSLVPGWNLISIPAILHNKTLGYALSSIKGSYSQVFTFNKKYVQLDANDEIDKSVGLWINMNQSDTLELDGSIPRNKTIDLRAGWNLIGYPTMIDNDVFDIVKNVSLFNLLTYDGSWLSYSPSRNQNSLEMMRPGYGYWVYVNESTSLMIS